MMNIFVHCIYGVHWERESIKSSDFLLGAGQGTKRGIAWERPFMIDGLLHIWPGYLCWLIFFSCMIERFVFGPAG